MKHLILILTSTLTIWSCSNHTEHKEVIEQYLFKENSFVDTQYKSLDFALIDTVLIKDEINRISKEIDSNLTELGEIFKIDIDKLNSYRSQELRYKNNKDYYTFLFSEDCYSKFCQELRDNITGLDSIISSFPDVDSLRMFELATWFEIRTWEYYGNEKYKKLYENINDYIIQTKVLNNEKNKLVKIDKDKIFTYIARNEFKIYNAHLKEVQTLRRDFLFNNNMEILSVKATE